PLFTEPGWNMHRFDEIGIDRSHAERGPEQEYYRTTPLSGLWTHTRGGFYHDGRFATLEDVVAHYDGVFGLGLSSAEKADLIEYPKSLQRPTRPRAAVTRRRSRSPSPQPHPRYRSAARSRRTARRACAPARSPRGSGRASQGSRPPAGSAHRARSTSRR